MRRIAIINQKGGVGKTTTTANLGAALSIQGRRVVLVDMDAQANLSLALGVEARSGSPTTYSVLDGTESIEACLRATKLPGLRLLPSNIDLSGAELELASAMGREYLLRDALKEWDEAHRQKHGKPAADYVLFDCPPSLGLLSINALAAAGEVLITLQTEFLALQGMSKLVEIVALLKKRLNPDLVVVGIVPTLYDIRLKLAREVLGEIRRYFKDQVMPHPIRANVKLAEAPSFAQTIFEYAPDSNGALDYMHLARAIIERESRDADLAGLSAFDAAARLPSANTVVAPTTRRMPPPRKKKEVDAPTSPAPQPVVAKTTTASESVAAKIESKAPPKSVPADSKPPTAHVIPAKSAAPTKAPVANKSISSTKAHVSDKTTASTKAPVADKSPASTKAPVPEKSPASTKASIPETSPVSTKASIPPKNRPSTRVAAPAKALSARTSAASDPKPKPSAVEEIHAQRATANGAQAKTPTANGTHPQSAPAEPAPARRLARTLKPVPRTARVDHIPPLPPDAFEILSTPIDP